MTEGKLREAELEWLAETPLHLRALQPTAAQGLPHKPDETLHPSLFDDLDKLGGKSRQHVQQVADAHEVVVAPHGVPVEGEKVLVIVAMTFLYKNSRLDALGDAERQGYTAGGRCPCLRVCWTARHGVSGL